MDEELDLSPLNGQHLDPELFRRVWERVMPDSEGSPLVLSDPQTGPAPLPSPSPAPPVCLSEASQADLPVLQTLMDQAQATLTALLPLIRRGNSAGRILTAMAADYRRILRQLSAARFLIAGQRYHPAGSPAVPPVSLPLALRDQFIRAKHWQWVCRQAQQSTIDPCLQELYEDLARTGGLHAGLIRSLLEQM